VCASGLAGRRIAQPYVLSVVTQAAAPSMATVLKRQSENRPSWSTYKKFAMESEWLKARGLYEAVHAGWRTHMAAATDNIFDRPD
jgi:hypothetical protein